MLRLAIELEGKRVETRSLEEGVLVVGRSRTCEVKINAPDISRSHLRLAVAGGQVMVEILSQFGAKLDGQPVEGTSAFKPGQRLTIGEITTLILEEAAGADVPTAAVGDSLHASVTIPEGATQVARRDRTGGATGAAVPAAGEKTEVDVSAGGSRAASPEPAGPSRDETGEDLPQPERTGPGMKTAADAGPPPSFESPSGDNVPRTQVSMDMGTESGHTRAMQTRMVSPEELELLRSVEQNRVRRRMILGAVIAIPVLILAIVFRPRSLPPETVLEWAMDAKGEFLDEFTPAPSGGFSDGGYDLMFPGGSRHTVTVMDGGIRVDFFIGRDHKVPMRLFLQETSDLRFVRMTRQKTMDEWIIEAPGSGGTWNIDRPYSTLFFIGREQGIPLLRVAYERQDDGSWFGVANVMRHGQRRIVLRAEIPAAERLRGERIVLKGFMRPSRQCERTHWEADGNESMTPTEDLLRDARREIFRMAPATWMEVEAMLRSALTKAVLAGDSAAQKEGLELLQELRKNEAAWFNSQHFALDNAEAQGDRERAFRVREFAKGVFSSMDDQRYYSIRKW